MKKTMFKKVLAGIAAVFTIGLCVPTGFTGTDFKPSFETVAESGSGWTLKNGVLTVSQGTTIVSYQFRGNTSIKEVKIGDNCTVESYAFQNCTSLANVTTGNCTVDTYAFQKCTSLANVTIGNGCTVNLYAFDSCTSLTNLIIGNDCKVNLYAFQNHALLTNVIIGNKCTIERWAFDGCNNILNVTCTGNMDTVSVNKNNPEIIWNKNKWYVSDHPHIFDANYKCPICGYFNKAAAQAEIEKHKAEIDRIQKLIDAGNNTASTFSDGSVLAIIGCSTFLVLCGLAAVIVVKRRKKTE